MATDVTEKGHYLGKREQLGGGGNGVLVTVVRAQTVDEFSYGQGGMKGGPALSLSLEVEGYDEPWEKNITFGGGAGESKWSVTDEGRGMKHADGWRISPRSNMGRFLQAFYDSIDALDGASDDDLIAELEDGSTDYTATFEGRQFRLGVLEYDNDMAASGKSKVPLLKVCPETLASLGGPVGKTATKGGKSPINKGKNQETLDEATESVIATLLSKTPLIKKSELAGKIQAEAKGDTRAAEMMRLSFKESWLADEARPFLFDKKKGVIRPQEAA